MMSLNVGDRVLLISNSTVYGQGYLDHAEAEVRAFLGKVRTAVFVPFALFDRQAYTNQARERFRRMDITLNSIHDVSNMQRTIAEAESIFIGGGNTFRLLKALYDFNLLEPIRKAVAAGVPFIGSSAGSIIAGPSLRTTKDMPVVQPPSFEALGLVPFHISPHYLDPDPNSKHMGETQEERIKQFLEENEGVVVGIREGSLIRVEGGSAVLKGPNATRVFRRGEQPMEVQPGVDLAPLIAETVAGKGRAA